jgi:putative aldouronate transport system permease protein
MVASRRSKGSSRKLYSSVTDRVYMGVVFGILWLSLLLVSIPLIFVLASSFSSAEAIAAGRVFLWPVGPNIEGYKLIFKTSIILVGYRNSIMYAALGTAINVVMTMLASYPLSRKDFRARNPIMMFFAITMFFNGGLIPTYLLVRNVGMLNTIWAMVIPTAMGIWFVIITRTYIQSNVPMELYESASMDGCSDFRFLLRIAVPLSKPIIAVIALLYAVQHWNGYFNALIYLRDEHLFPLQLILRDILIHNLGMGDPTDVTEQMERLYFSYLLKYSVIVVASVPVMAIYPLAQKYFIRGIMIGALKG